jgi:hypothetical protein
VVGLVSEFQGQLLALPEHCLDITDQARHPGDDEQAAQPG